MKAVLISIKPKWCHLIATGQKTVEVRKTKPKLQVPFKVYIYCTLPPREELFCHGGIYEYASELIRLQSGEIVYDYGMRLCCDPEGRPYSSDNFLCRKVIGEFICDEIRDCRDVFIEPTCLSTEEWLRYTDGYKRQVWGWHISDLKIYEKAKPLNAFYKECPGLDNTGMCWDCEMANGEECDCTINAQLHLTHPPQSWCYVDLIREGQRKDE